MDTTASPADDMAVVETTDPTHQESGSDRFFWVPPPQPDPGSDEARAVESAWQDQALWSAVGSSIGDSILRWRIFAAVAGVLGLALTVAAGIGWFGNGHAATVFATVGVLLLAAVPYLRQHLVSDQRVQQWTLARVASEDLKQSIYRHLMGVLQPVAGGGSSTDQSAANLVRRCRDVKKKLVDLAEVAAATVPPPPSKDRLPPTSLTIEGYVAKRVQGQMTWFRAKGEHNGRITLRLRRVELVLGLVTVLMGAWASGLSNAPDADTMPRASEAAVAAAADAAAAGGRRVAAPALQPASAAQAAADGEGAASASEPADATPPSAEPEDPPAGPARQQSGWLAMLALLAAATGAITTYLAASRHAELSRTYFDTYDRLKDLLAEWRVAPDRDQPERVARFVDAVEQAISGEYGGWAAGWKATPQAAK